MKCNVCQDDMIRAKSGWMCLNCGNSIIPKPADTPLIVSGVLPDTTQAATSAPVVDPGLTLSAAVVTPNADPAAGGAAAASLTEAPPPEDNFEAAAEVPADEPQPTAEVESTTEPLPVSGTEAIVSPAGEVVSASAVVPQSEPAFAAEAETPMAAAESVASDPTSLEATFTDAAVTAAEFAGPQTKSLEAPAPADAPGSEPEVSHVPEPAADSFDVSAVTDPEPTFSDQSVSAESSDSPALAEPTPDQTDSDGPHLSEGTPVVPEPNTPDALVAATVDEVQPEDVTVFEPASVQPEIASEPVPGSEAQMLTGPDSAEDPVPGDDTLMPPADDATVLPAETSQAESILPVASIPEVAASDEEQAVLAAAGSLSVDSAVIATSVEPTVAPPALEPLSAAEGAIDGLGSARGNAVLNLKPATEGLTRSIDRTAPAVDSIGRQPVAAADLHAPSLIPPANPSAMASLAEPKAPDAAASPALAGPLTSAVVASDQPSTAAEPVTTVASGLVATSDQPGASTGVMPPTAAASPLPSRDDALKRALGSDVAAQIASAGAAGQVTSKQPDFLSQLAAPLTPKTRPQKLPKYLAAGIATGVVAVILLIGGFYFFHHTSGTTTSLVPHGSKSYTGTSLARATSGGADAGTKADVVSPTPVAIKTLPGGQTDATRLAGRDARRRADVAAYASAYKQTATRGYFLSKAPAVSVDAADPSSARPYSVQTAEVSVTGQIRYWAGGQCTGKAVAPGVTSTRYLSLQTKLEDGSVYCFDVK